MLISPVVSIDISNLANMTKGSFDCRKSYHFSCLGYKEGVGCITPMTAATDLPPFVGPVSMRAFHSPVLHRTLANSRQ